MYLFLLAVLTGLPALAEAQQQSTAFYLVNRSAQTIENIYLSSLETPAPRRAAAPTRVPHPDRSAPDSSSPLTATR